MSNLPEDIQDAIDHAIEDAVDQGYEVKKQFWKSDVETASYVFMMTATEVEIDFPDFDLASLPRGYWLGFTIFGFEQQCLGGGWAPLCSIPEEKLKALLQAYTEVGCPEEAAAVAKAYGVAQQSGTSIEEIGAAYSSVENPWKSEEVRHAKICGFFKATPNLFSS